jgi:hydrogenase/urease accessory protein HupE
MEFNWNVAKPSSTNPVAAGFERGAGQPSRTFADFVRLGIEHILSGYDHLLYLLGLILACHRFRSILPIITSFTVAHSLTLGLATIGAMSVPSSVVEPVIAASIVYVGAENLWLRGREPRRRWAGAFLFGLIHGFGFAGLLREVGVGSDGQSVVLPLFSFNLGVELGQLALVSIALPVLSWARRQRFVEWGLPASSAIVGLVGLYWFLERVSI